MILSKRIALASQFAWLNIVQKRKRVALAVIGVAIGIAAVSSMLLFGYSVEAKVHQSLESLGADVLTVTLTPSNSFEDEGGLDESLDMPAESSRGALPNSIGQLAMANDLLRTMPEVQVTSRFVRDMTCRIEDATPVSFTEMKLVDTTIFEVLSLVMADGRYLTPGDTGQDTIVLGSEAISRIRREAPNVGVGSVLTICGKSMIVSGIMMPHAGQEAMPMVRMNESALRIFSRTESEAANENKSTLILARLYGQAFSKDLDNTVLQRLKHVLNAPVSVQGAMQLGQLRKDQSTLYTRFLAVVGSISLLVGSLGIANVMLVAVSERRAEIGLRMAIGANKLDIVLQFLLESAAICLIGAVLGLIFGGLGAAGALYFANISLSISPAIVIISCGVAVICGLLAGAYPAQLASEVDPITSLRGND